ncbi:MAG: type III PLP-dependent enzyme [Pseudomonadota bacterium]
MDQYNDGVALAKHAPDDAVLALRPHEATRAARRFVSGFPGYSFYAVKANPSPAILEALWQGGIRNFDVASLAEIALVDRLFPDATMALMHPVKSEATIRAAYFDHGVRIFALDHKRELEKIVAATGGADDLVLVVRLQVENPSAKLSLSRKFGVPREAAPTLLRAARGHALQLGISFHVGSQAMDPRAYARAMDRAGDVIRDAATIVDIVDVGGGFPVAYPGMTPPALSNYFATIRASLRAIPVGENVSLWCEPGRALVAAAGATVVRVIDRRDDCLYINDGTYGSLFDAGQCAWRFPVKRLSEEAGNAFPLRPFSFFGPTCDDIDYMEGPFMLPADIVPGDYIEIGMLGAYGAAMRTDFNGFGPKREVILLDSVPDQMATAARATSNHHMQEGERA